MDVLFVLRKVLLFVAMCVPSFILQKRNMLPDKSEKGFSAVLLYVGQPLMVLASFQDTLYRSGMIKNMLLALLFSVVGQIILYFLSLLLFIKKPDCDKTRVLKYATTFSNCGFLGLPLLYAIYGNGASEMIIYLSIYVAVFNLLSWTLGSYILTKEKKYIKWKNAIFNPPTIALAVALPLFFCGISIGKYSPECMRFIEYFDEMVAPLAMIVLGIRLAKADLKKVFTDLDAYIVSAYKLILAPILMLLIMLPFGAEKVVTIPIFFAMAMPCASSSIVFAEKHDVSPETAATCVMVSTILCVATLPILFYIFI